MENITDEWLEQCGIKSVTLVPGLIQHTIPSAYRCHDVAEIRQEYETLTLSPLTETLDYLGEVVEHIIRSSMGQEESVMKIRSDRYDAASAMTRITVNSVGVRHARKLSHTDAWTYEIEDESDSIDAISVSDTEYLERQMREVVASNASQQFDIWAKPLPDRYTIDNGIRRRGKKLWVYDIERPGGGARPKEQDLPTLRRDSVSDRSETLVTR